MQRRKFLFLQKRLLFPTDSGGKIRTLNVLRHLAQWHDITYLCNILPDEEPHRQEMEAIGVKLDTIPWLETPRHSLGFYRDLAFNLFSKYPYNVNKDYDSRVRSRLIELLNRNSYDLLICDFVQMARNCLGITTVPKLLFEHNVESQIFERHARNDSGAARRGYMWLQWRKMHRFERNAGFDFDRVVAVSKQDRETYQREYGWQHVDVIDTAVNTDYFKPLDEEEVQRRCVFIGSMDWLPNEDGVRRFVNDTWPMIRQKYPDATFTVVGRNPTPSIRALDGRDGVAITGSVPDVRPHVARAQVVVIPLLVGGGTRLKVFEAMGMGKPIVSTSLGVEGLDVTDQRDVLIGNSPREFADQVSRLFEEQDLRNRLAETALQMVQMNYSSEVIARQFDEICQKTINGRNG